MFYRIHPERKDDHKVSWVHSRIEQAKNIVSKLSFEEVDSLGFALAITGVRPIDRCRFLVTPSEFDQAMRGQYKEVTWERDRLEINGDLVVYYHDKVPTLAAIVTSYSPATGEGSKVCYYDQQVRQIKEDVQIAELKNKQQNWIRKSRIYRPTTGEVIQLGRSRQ